MEQDGSRLLEEVSVDLRGSCVRLVAALADGAYIGKETTDEAKIVVRE